MNKPIERMSVKELHESVEIAAAYGGQEPHDRVMEVFNEVTRRNKLLEEALLAIDNLFRYRPVGFLIDTNVMNTALKRSGAALKANRGEV